MDPSLHFLLAHDFQCNNWMTQGSNTNSKDDGVPWSFVFPKTSYLLSASEASSGSSAKCGLWGCLRHNAFILHFLFFFFFLSSFYVYNSHLVDVLK